MTRPGDDGDGTGDYWSTYRRRVDDEIARATRDGAFRDLPGAGKPLRSRPDDEHWWVREKLRREGVSTDALLPTSLRLRKEVHALPEAVRTLRTEDAVRRAAADLDRRVLDWILIPTPPQVVVPRVDVEAVVARWRAERPAPPPPPVAPAPPLPRPSRWRWLPRRRARRATEGH